jgi:hypothetical protein
LDDGASFETLGVLEGGTVIGRTCNALADGSSAGWDHFGYVDVELLTDRDWLEGRSAESVLAGGNLALVGDELIQFRIANALGPRRFRLRGLLRGRRGTETAMPGHRLGERFVLIEPRRMLAFDPPLEMLGYSGMAKPYGNGDQHVEAAAFVVAGAALRPLSPTHLTTKWLDNNLVINWRRRSRSGFGWNDFVDAPMGETTEAYGVVVRLDGRVVRRETILIPRFVYGATDFYADGGGGVIEVGVAQMSADIGPGAMASITTAANFMEAL